MLRTLSIKEFWRVFRRLPPDLIRFILAGLVVTMVSASVYAGLASGFGIHPLLANCQAYLVGVLLGYRIHGHWTFRGQGNMHDGSNGRFLIGSLSALFINVMWTWLLTDAWGGPAWLPVLPMIFVTPIISFAVNQRWVFGKRASPGGC